MISRVFLINYNRQKNPYLVSYPKYGFLINIGVSPKKSSPT